LIAIAIIKSKGERMTKERVETIRSNIRLMTRYKVRLANLEVPVFDTVDAATRETWMTPNSVLLFASVNVIPHENALLL
jgi:hypothetical protein